MLQLKLKLIPSDVEENDLDYQQNLQNNPDYQKAVQDSQIKAPISNEEMARQEDFIKQQRDVISKELSDSPLYKAEDDFNFNLQLFGNKDVKSIADDYRNDRLTDQQQQAFELVAENNGYSSGDKLAKDILSNNLKDQELEARVKTATDIYKKQNGLSDTDNAVKDSVNEGSLKKTALEQASMSQSVSDKVSGIMDSQKAIQDTARAIEDASNVIQGKQYKDQLNRLKSVS